MILEFHDFINGLWATTWAENRNFASAKRICHSPPPPSFAKPDRLIATYFETRNQRRINTVRPAFLHCERRHSAIPRNALCVLKT